MLRNFGVLANYTYVDPNIRYLTGSGSVTRPLIGLSKHAANGTLYYETPRFSVRGSVAYRSRYLTAVPGTEGNAYNGTSATTNVDAQVSYNVTDAFKLSLEAINIIDTFNDQFVDDTNRLNVRTHSGRQFLLGARYAFCARVTVSPFANLAAARRRAAVLSRRRQNAAISGSVRPRCCRAARSCPMSVSPKELTDATNDP